MLDKNNFQNATAVNGTDDGGAVSDILFDSAPWYVVYVKPNHERKAKTYLEKLGYVVYLPLQKQIKEWSDRKVKRDYIVIPMILFVKSISEADSIKKLDRLSFVSFVMQKPGSRELAKVPAVQVMSLRLLLENSSDQVILQTGQVKKGDHVRIRFGKMKGIEGYVTDTRDNLSRVVVTIDYLGYATLSVNVEDLEFAE